MSFSPHQSARKVFGKSYKASQGNGNDSNLEAVFPILDLANTYEDEGDIAKAYDNYTHAVMLMEQELTRLEKQHHTRQQRLQKSPSRKKKNLFHPKKTSQLPLDEISLERQQWEFDNVGVVPLLRDRIQHYSRHADEIMHRHSPTASSPFSSRAVASAPMLPDASDMPSNICGSTHSNDMSQLNASNRSLFPEMSSEEEVYETIQKYIEESNASLTRALDLDSNNNGSVAKDHYIKAGDSLLRAINYLREHSEKCKDPGRRTSKNQFLMGRLETITSRAEQLEKKTNQDKAIGGGN